MPTDGADELGRMAGAFALVAAVSVPAGLVAWRLGRRTTAPPLPAPAADDSAFALGYLLLFLAYQVVVGLMGQAAVAVGLPRWVGVAPDPETAGTWQGVFGGLLVAPLLLVGWLAFAGRRGGAGRAVAGGVGGWLVVTPVVLVVHKLAEWATTGLAVDPQEHPLVAVIRSAGGGTAAVALSVTLATPFAEEVVFRGLLLGWLVRRPPAAALPVGLAVLVAATTGVAARGPLLVFVAALVVGQLALRRRPTAGAVWATATLFAVAHAGVWPTPVPLFLLGLALGAVAVRTGGVLAGTVFHGLFNAVSLVYLVRG